MSNSPGAAADRSRLTDDQKKHNHIVSEQKRRQAIRAGFDRLASLMDGYEGQGRSEAVVLEAAVKTIRAENARKEKLWKRLQAKGGITRAEFESHYVMPKQPATEHAEAHTDVTGDAEDV